MESVLKEALRDAEREKARQNIGSRQVGAAAAAAVQNI
jgi:hypothetical protein